MPSANSLLYKALMARTDPARKLYLAITDVTHANTFRDPIVLAALEDYRLPLLVFRPGAEQITQWEP